jgi:predicted CoA-binding protein
MNKQRTSVAIIGASADRAKYGNKSVRAHMKAGFDVYPINPRCDTIEGLKCYPSIADVPLDRLHSVSMYVPPTVGITLLPAIAAKGCDELWLNPGSESDALIMEAQRLGLNPIVACSIIGVGETPMSFGDR